AGGVSGDAGNDGAGGYRPGAQIAAALDRDGGAGVVGGVVRTAPTTVTAMVHAPRITRIGRISTNQGRRSTPCASIALILSSALFVLIRLIRVIRGASCG